MGVDRNKNRVLFWNLTSSISQLNKRLRKPKGAIKNRQSRDTGNIGHK